MTISADNIYSDTLQSIVDAKLKELEKKKDIYERSRASVKQALASQHDEAEKVRILKAGIKTCFKLDGTSGGVSWAGTNTDLVQLMQNLDRFLEQPRYDPSLSSHQLKTWADSIEHYFEVQSSRYEFASLYAKLVTEWLVSEGRLSNKDQAIDINMSGSFEELESSAKLQSRKEWEKVVFKAFETDPVSIRDLLAEVFGEKNGNRDLAKALKAMRAQFKVFERQLSSPGQFNTSTLRWTVRGLVSSDLLSEEKRTVLKDFLNNEVIMSEIADVLNLRMVNIKDWTWGSTVPLLQQRKLAGIYSISMQEDLLQAILLQYIGIKWSVFLKQAFTAFVKHPGAWHGFRKDVSKTEQKRRDYYLGSMASQVSVQSTRNTLWLNRYFMTQLLDSYESSGGAEDGAEEADFSTIGTRAQQQQAASNVGMMQQAQVQQQMQQPQYQQQLMQLSAQNSKRLQMARQQQQQPQPMKQMASQAPAHGSSLFGSSNVYKRPRQVNSDDHEAILDDFFDDEDDDTNRNAIDLKQGLLHLLRTEILTNTKTRGATTAFRAQFESWNSLMPHSTILVVAEYLGVSKDWIKFFKTFMQAPLGFVDDDALEESRIRQRGVPGSHALSDILGEMILFCLDVNINQATKGQKLWRVHDDLWFWSAEHDKAVEAWSTITRFADVLGLSLDTKKAGSVCVSRGEDVNLDTKSGLPEDKIRWGFLYLDSRSGEWEIDDNMVDAHTDELDKQLRGKLDSVLSWVQAWNAYANNFFTTNFGKPAKCLGRKHSQKVLKALERAQKKLFQDGESTNVVDYLKDILESRFGITNIPDGYYFFPTELGGLQLRNPFISLLLAHETFDKHNDPESMLDTFAEAESDEYEKRKRLFDQGKVSRQELDDPYFVPDGADKEIFMPFEEFVRHREESYYDFRGNLRETYRRLLQQGSEYNVTATSDIMTAMNLMDKGGVIAQSAGINGNWYNMTPYWKWVAQMYGGEIVKRFGGLNIVDNGVLPIGMVSIFRSDRVKWKS